MSEATKQNVLEKLTAGVMQLTTSERWTEWLRMQSRFHHYSFNNTLLILAQRPDASRVAGYNAWRQLDRFVREGEKAIWIMAPMIYKTKDEAEIPADEVTRVLRGFKPVTVFDVSQTDGQELPEICARLDGDDTSDVYARLLGFAQELGFTVEDSADLGTANGDCSHDLHRIRVLSTTSPIQRVKTLAHELGHALLHEHFDSRPVAELEAESVAYVVCANLGINTDDYSFGYVTNWARGGDEAIAAIKASGTRIQSAADRILSAIGDEAVQNETALPCTTSTTHGSSTDLLIRVPRMWPRARPCKGRLPRLDASWLYLGRTVPE